MRGSSLLGIQNVKLQTQERNIQQLGVVSVVSERGITGSGTNFYWYGLGWTCQLSTSPLKHTQSLHSDQPARQTPESMQHGTVLTEKSRHGGHTGHTANSTDFSWCLLKALCSTCLIWRGFTSRYKQDHFLYNSQCCSRLASPLPCISAWLVVTSASVPWLLVQLSLFTSY